MAIASGAAAVIGAALALALMVAMVRDKFWRCPKCGKMLPKGGKVRCQSCGWEML